MKRTSTGTPYLSFCLVVRNCAPTLEATLQSIRDRAPDCEIVVVDTCSRDETPEIARRFADVFEVYTGPRNTWNTEMYAVDDMTAARQRSFDLASGFWRAWADGDDRVVGGEEALRYLRINCHFKPEVGSATLAKPEEEIGGSDGMVGLEDLLHWIEENHPKVTLIKCPYLYRRDEDDVALQWHERERFARWDDPKRFKWAEAAHEILIPVGGYIPPDTKLPHVVWVHEKKWTADDNVYSLKRHSAIILEEFEGGQRTFRKAHYLAQFAEALWPERELEFLSAAHQLAYTVVDRYRSLIAHGAYRYRRGLFMDGREAFDAAIGLRPDLADAYYAGAQVACAAEDFDRAVLLLRKGILCHLPTESEVSPRDHAITYPTMLALGLLRVAKVRVHVGLHPAAVDLYQEAVEIALKVRNRTEIQEDRDQAQALVLRADNLLRVQRAAMHLSEVAQILCANDEPAKAVQLAAAFPWSAEDHPLRLSLEVLGKKISRHMTDPAAYAEFYGATLETGYKPMPSECYTFEKSHSRVKWMAEWIKANKPNARVLDLGSCDGILGIPILMTCPGITYHAVDVNPVALENFLAMLKAHKLVAESEALTVEAVGGVFFRTEDGRITLEQGVRPVLAHAFDLVLVGEIIEHVPDPVSWLKDVALHCKAGGTILATTPWGSFDEGHPPPATAYGTPRDERGHLRAFSAWSAYETFRRAGLQVDEVKHVGNDLTVGHAMLISAREEEREERPVAAFVASALWDWNGSTVDADGIGASEEMIIRLGERVSTEREFNVFGPVPDAEVYRGVGYFDRDTVRNVPRGTKILVSRSPGSHRRLDDMGLDKHDMVLWLQDTYYSDLTPEVAARYERIVTVSEWHRQYTAAVHPGVPIEKIDVAYNFLQREHWEGGIQSGWHGAKKADHFIYASSPDRGLIKLLQLWPGILERLPDATLSVFYGWRGAAKLGGGMGTPEWGKRYMENRRLYERLRWQKGVREVGMVNHYQLAAEYMLAGVWAYPTDFHETGCLSACKARAGGAVPVASSLAALNETARCDQGSLIDVVQDSSGVFYPDGYDDAFLDAVERAAKVSTEDRQAMARHALEVFEFEAIRPTWERILS